MLTHGIPPAFRDGVHIYRQPPSGQSRVYRTTQLLRTDGVDAGPPVVLKVVRVTDATFSGFTMDHFLYVSFSPQPLLVSSSVDMHDTERVEGGIHSCNEYS